MICLRCGYCCIHYDVIIVNDPELGLVEENLVHKPCGVRCQHLLGTIPGQYVCAVHDRSWYEETPCFSYGQIEPSPDTRCRMGVYTLKALERSKEG
jgi:hypothetical protein